MKVSKKIKLVNIYIMSSINIFYVYSVYFTNGIYDFPRIMIISSLVTYFIIQFFLNKTNDNHWILLGLYVLPILLPILVKTVTYYNFLDSPHLAGPTVDFALVIIIIATLMKSFSSKYLSYFTSFLFAYFTLFLYRVLFYFASHYNSSVILNEIVPFFVMLSIVGIFTIFRIILEEEVKKKTYNQELEITNQIYVTIGTSVLSIFLIVNYYSLFEYHEESTLTLFWFLLIDTIYILTIVSWIIVILKKFFNGLQTIELKER